MNKLLVVLLAVCLVSVHAFVKRDAAAAAPASAQTNLESIAKDLEALSKSIGDAVTKALDPEKIKNDFNAMVDKLQEGIEILTSPQRTPPKK